MNDVQLLQNLQDHGICLAADGPHLIVDAPRGMLTESLKKTLAIRKAGLMSLLRAETQAIGTARKDQKQKSQRRDPFANAKVLPLDGSELFLSAVPSRCRVCKNDIFWRRVELEHWVCDKCHPPAVKDVVYACRTSFHWRARK